MLIYYTILFVIMFLLSIGYYQGLRWFFRYNFKWDYAAVVGIAFTVCVTALVYWLPKYGQSTTVDLVSSLFFAFAGALYFMMDFRRILERDRVQDKIYQKNLEIRCEKLEQQIFEQATKQKIMEAQIKKIMKSHKRVEAKLSETLGIIGLRELAEQHLKTFEN